ncbi:MAG: NTP transferase domain-containing protein [Bacteroidia bacterium]
MNQIYGLVICGGKSSRMGADKSLLNYHGMPQRYYLYEMLGMICEKVFLSCNREQANSVSGKYNVILDAPQYENIGPMAALLSAFELHNDFSYLTVGCDYPFIKKEDLQKLIDARNENSMAASFFNIHASIYEPLLAIYENKSFGQVKKNFKEKKYSLRYFLEEINAAKIFPISPDVLTGINTKEQYEEALKRILTQNN